MCQAAREIALEAFKSAPSPLLENLTDLAKVPRANRTLFQNLVAEAVIRVWYPNVTGIVRGTQALAHLKRIIKLADKLHGELSPPPALLQVYEEVLDHALRQHVKLLRELVLVASHIYAGEELRAKKPHGGQTRKGTKRPPFELFAASVYRAALDAGGKLTFNKNGDGKKFRAGKFGAVLDRLRPHLPPNFIPKVLPLSALNEIAKEVDSEPRSVA
jgi:hypothetical protein